MPRATVLLAALALSLAACTRTLPAAQDDVGLGEPLRLKVGETARVRGTPLRVRFVGAADSRCPADVVCVAAGDATVALAVSGAGAERADTLFLFRQPRSSTYGGYLLELVELDPFPVSTVQNPSRVVTLRVTRAG
jgi:hypothetical protein